MVPPPGKALDAARRLGAMGHLGGHGGALGPGAADPTTDQRGEGGPGPHHLALMRVWRALYHGLGSGTISVEVVAHGRQTQRVQ